MQNLKFTTILFNKSIKNNAFILLCLHGYVASRVNVNTNMRIAYYGRGSPIYSRVQWFSTFSILPYGRLSWMRFTCSETIKKQTKNSHTYHWGDALAVFKMRRATGSLRIGAGSRNSGNIFRKDQKILAKTKIWNLKFIS